MSSGSIRIIQLPEKSSVNTDDYMAVDSSANGTKKIKFTDLLDNNLSTQNKAADAQATGEAISELNTNINNTNTRIDNMINTQQNASVTTLWTGSIDKKNQTATLSESIANFDFVDIYIGGTDTVFARKPVSSSVHFEIQTQNMSDDASVQFLRWYETGLTISGTTATIDKAIRCYWDDFSTQPVVAQAGTDGGATIVRIDGVKIGHVENDEIVDARVGADGITYPTLGDAIRGQVTDLKDDIKDITENEVIKLSTGYIATDSSTADINDVVAHAHYYHAVVSCSEGDKFTINAKGGGTPRAFAFLESDGTIIYASASGKTVTDCLLIAPTDTAYLVINDYDNLLTSYVGWKNSDKIDIINDSLYGGQTVSFSGNTAYNYFYHYLKSGNTYVFHNSTSATCGLRYLNFDGTIEVIGSLTANTSLTINPQNDYMGLVVYLNSSGTVTLTTVSLFADINNEISEINKYFDGSINYSEIKTIAESAGLTVSGDTISRGSQGTFTFTLSGQTVYPTLVKAKVAYSSDAPYLEISGDNTYSSIRMELFGDEILGIAEIRIPPLDCGKNTSYSITVALPVGATISYLEFVVEKSLQRRATYDGVDVNAHLGFTSLSPENTMPSFIAAYMSGYDAIICNPKLTADGVWVCCHDTTINRTARNTDGTSISSTVTISETNYNDLLQYDFGIAYDSEFAGTTIPKLEDFLELCAVTGIRPIFSMHQSSGFETLVPLVKKYGQLEKLVLKIGADLTVINAYYQAFGNIHMYDVVINDPSEDLSDAITAIQQSDSYGANCLMMIDVPVTYITQTVAETITDANLICGIYDLQYTLFKKYKECLEFGVTQFTDDRYPVVGLKWV